ncbi:MAG: hypothetical protein AB8F34_15695 [Akkermansiaceae bacterium]
MLRVFSLLLIIATTAPVIAQESEREVSAAFYAFKYAEGLKVVYLRTGENSYEPIALSTANMVGPIKARVTGGNLSLHSRASNEEGKTAYPKVGSVKVPDGISKVLIILAPRTKTNIPSYQTLLVDRGETNFQPGSYKLINLSPYPIRGAIGRGTRFLCNNGKISTFKTKGTPGQALPVLFQYQKNDRWQRLTETRWAHSKNKRTLLCAYFDRSSRRMRLRSIPDNIARNQPKAVADD